MDFCFLSLPQDGPLLPSCNPMIDEDDYPLGPVNQPSRNRKARNVDFNPLRNILLAVNTGSGAGSRWKLSAADVSEGFEVRKVELLEAIKQQRRKCVAGIG